MKEKYHKKLFFILIIVSIIITGCSTGSSNKSSFNIGTKGIIIEKAAGNPNNIYESEYFAIGLLIKNVGASDSSNAIININYDDYFLRLDRTQSANDKTTTLSLEGRKRENPAGGIDYLEYVFEANTFNVLREKVDTTININLCYDYKTDLSTEFCIDAVSRTNNQKISACKTKTFTSSSGQGAPVGITKIEPELMILKDKIRPVFRIYIKNLDNGYILKPDMMCGEQYDSKELNKLNVKAWISKDIELKCEPEEVKLNNKEGIVRCSVKDSDLDKFQKGSPSYITILRVVLDYKYVSSESIKLKINRISDFEIKSPTICGYYEKFLDDRCVSLCEYCVKNPSDPDCSRNIDNGFSWVDATDFSCSCSKEKCLQLSKDNKCIFGYCPGTSYCCSTDECRDKPDGEACGNKNVCINKKCSRTSICEYSYGQQNYTCTDSKNCLNNTIKKDLCYDGVCCKIA